MRLYHASCVPETLREHLRAQADAVEIIDTHEHVPDERCVCDGRHGFFSFFDHYVSSDLVSAGMPYDDLLRMRDLSNGLTLEERWALMSPYWPFVRTTGYGRAMLEYMSDLFGADDINEGTYQELDRRILGARQPGWYEIVLKEKARIEVSLVTVWPHGVPEIDKRYFRAVPILDHFAMAACEADVAELEQQTGGATIHSLERLMEAQEQRLDTFHRAGAVGVKVFLAYRRTLNFEDAERATARRLFERVRRARPDELRQVELKPLQDFMMRRLVGLAAERGLPLQVHTGLQEGNGNIIENSNPTHLAPVFLAYPEARFDLFHAGYPFVSQLTTLAKNFQNVYADLCWIQEVSPTVAARALNEWFDALPANKILAAGGDSNYAEGAYGHLQVARKIVADVLAEKVVSGHFSEEEAGWMMRRVLRENAKALFSL